MLKVSDYIVRFLEECGIRHVFMLSGGGAMHLNDSFGKATKMKYVCTLHEQAASIAAEGYARVTDGVGLVNVTTGPGSTNAITGIAGAWVDSIPVIVVSGQVKQSDLLNGGLRQNGYQELNIIDIVRPITKYSELVIEPEKIRYHLEKALYLATSGRPGPVWLDIPLDIQATQVDEKTLKGFTPEKENEELGKKALSRQVEEVITLLLSAKRPVLLAGNGVRLAHGLPEFERLVEALRIPVLLTWGAIDFLPDDHELYFGRPNMLGGQRAASFVIQNSDFLLVIGARLGIQQIGYNHESFARGAKLAMVDISEAELDKKILHPALKIKSDAKVFMEEMLNRLNGKAHKTKKHAEWIGRCLEWNKKYPVSLPEYCEEQGHVNPYVFVDVLSGLLSENDVIVPSSSATAYITSSQAFKIKRGQRFLTSRGMAAMGWDLPSAIGACVGSGRRTICITGDGSIQMNIQELQTIITYSLPIKIFVLSNGGYVTIRNTQKNYFGSHFVGCDKTSGVCLPDILEVAKAYGFKTERIRHNGEIREKIKKVLSWKEPTVCELVGSPDQQITPRLSSTIDANGKIVSRPLEDLHPLLSREELKKNILVSDKS